MKEQRDPERGLGKHILQSCSPLEVVGSCPSVYAATRRELRSGY